MIDEIDLVKVLKEKKISGEELSQIFNVSRTAIWKKINKLKTFGYEIKIDKTGYKIIKSPDKLLPYEIIPHLKTKFIGKNYIYFDEIDSTNLEAKRQQYKDGTVILAEYQSAGRGRKNRNWHSNKYKGLYFSIVLYPQIEVKYLPLFSLLFNYSIFKVLKKILKGDLKIKWPNDIYLNDKKIAGFLIESGIENNQITKLIVGIGININQTLEDFPSDIENLATSLLIEENKKFKRDKIFLKILFMIEKDYRKFLKEKYLNIKDIENNLLWKGENIVIMENNQIITSGKLIGLNEDGSLKIENSKGIEYIYVGDLSIRFNSL